jgi:NifU-like protein involved in Fe-S cluster formation
MNAPLYTTEILRLAASLSEQRSLQREDGRAELRSPTCGSRIDLAVQIDADGQVEALSQRVHACAFGQASAALMEQGARGRSRSEIETTLSTLGNWLGGAEPAPDWPNLSALAPARSRKSRHGAVMLPFRALLAAMDGSGRG